MSRIVWVAPIDDTPANRILSDLSGLLHQLEQARDPERVIRVVNNIVVNLTRGDYDECRHYLMELEFYIP